MIPMRFLVALCLFTIVGCSGGPDPAAPSSTSTTAPAPKGTYPQATSRDLFNAYEANVVAADQKYKGKPLVLKGLVDAIDRDGLGMSIVANDSGSYPPSIECRFHDSTREQLASVKKGQTVTVVGTVTGSRQDARAWQKVVVTLDGCRLARPGE
jgi:hypothetical protein